MRALVIGGCGFLGGAVARELMRQGCDVTAFDKSVDLEIEGVSYIRGDITVLSSLKRAMKNVDEVYHYAGELRTTELFDNSYAAVYVKITKTLNILNAMHDLAIEIWGSGDRGVDLVYSEDAARVGVDRMQLDPMENDVLYIDAIRRVNVSNAANKIISTTKSKSYLRQFPLRRGEDETSCEFDTQGSFGAYTTELDRGLLKTVSYFSGMPKDMLREASAFYDGCSDVSGSDLTIQARKQVETDERAT